MQRQQRHQSKPSKLQQTPSQAYSGKLQERPDLVIEACKKYLITGYFEKRTMLSINLNNKTNVFDVYAMMESNHRKHLMSCP